MLKFLQSRVAVVLWTLQVKWIRQDLWDQSNKISTCQSCAMCVKKFSGAAIASLLYRMVYEEVAGLLSCLSGRMILPFTMVPYSCRKAADKA